MTTGTLIAFAILIVILVVIAGIAWLNWAKIQHWFADSETILWARIQVLVGALWGVLLVTDLTPFLNAYGLGKAIPAYMLISGIVTEMARRNRATDL
jgi:hypothetical protein